MGKEEKRKEKRLKEKEKRMKKKRKSFKQMQLKEEFDDTPEQLDFNEVVHAPPKLLGVKNNEARRPGKSKDLILLNGDKRRISENSIKNKNKPFKETKTKKKVKQKNFLGKTT